MKSKLLILLLGTAVFGVGLAILFAAAAVMVVFQAFFGR